MNDESFNSIIIVGLIFASCFSLGGLYFIFLKGIIYRAPLAAFGRIIRDHKLTWKYSIKPAAVTFFLISLAFMMMMSDLLKLLFTFKSYMAMAAASACGYFMMYYVNCWRSYNFGILIDGSRNILDVPASDVPQNFADTVKLRQFFDHGRRETLRLSELERIDNVRVDDKKEKGIFLTLSGAFGSRLLEFSSKQKRDECRTALVAELKLVENSSLRSDTNWDF